MNYTHEVMWIGYIYIPRKEGGRGLTSVEDTVNLAKIGLERYTKGSNERLLITARGDTEHMEIDAENEFKRRIRHERKTE